MDPSTCLGFALKARHDFSCDYELTYLTFHAIVKKD